MTEKEYLYDSELERRGIVRSSKKYNDAITEAMYWLRKNQPYYGLILDEMVKVVTTSTETAGICFSSNSGILLLLNPDFFAIHSIKHRVGIIQHECIHLISGHLTRIPRLYKSISDETKRKFASLAAELAVNSLIDSRYLPESAITTSKIKIQIRDTSKMKDAWENVVLTSRESLESYFVKLCQLADKKNGEYRISLDGKRVSSSELNELDDHSIFIESVDIYEDENGEVKVKPATDSEFNSDVIDAILSEIGKKIRERAKGYGLHSKEIDELIEGLIKKNSVNFRSVFAGAIGRHLGISRVSSMMRPSKRQQKPPGKRRQNDVLEVFYYQDVSGSMSDEEVRIGLSEAVFAERSGRANVMVQQFDTDLLGELQSVSKCILNNSQFKRFGIGGTNLAKVFKHADRHQPDLVIVATDGCFSYHDKPKTNIKVIWLLTHDGSVPTWGESIRLPSLDQILAGNKAKNILESVRRN